MAYIIQPVINQIGLKQYQRKVHIWTDDLFHWLELNLFGYYVVFLSEKFYDRNYCFYV